MMKKQPKSKMRQLSLFVDERSLFEKLCDIHYLMGGFKAVKRNGGNPGIDGVSIKDFNSNLDEELAQLKKELESWSYKPKPVKRVEILKPGNAGVRLLGIPCVRDRVVHSTIKQLLEPVIDPVFSDNSYGFRPGCSPQLAVSAAKEIVKTSMGVKSALDLDQLF